MPNKSTPARMIAGRLGVRGEVAFDQVLVLLGEHGSEIIAGHDLGHAKQPAVNVARGIAQLGRIDVAKVLDRAGDFRTSLFQQGQPKVVAGHARVELVAGRGALGRLHVAVGDDHVIAGRGVDDLFDAEGQISDVGDLRPLAQVDRRVISRAAPRADEPFPFAAEVDELLAGQVEVVQGDGRLQGGHDDGGAAAQSGGDRHVSQHGHVEPPHPHVLIAVLQPEDGGLDVVAPMPGGKVNHVPHPLAVDEVEPIAPGHSAHDFRNLEADGLELAGLGIDGLDLVVAAESHDGHGFAVDGQEIGHSAAMIDVPAHQIDPPRRTGRCTPSRPCRSAFHSTAARWPDRGTSAGEGHRAGRRFCTTTASTPADRPRSWPAIDAPWHIARA